MIDKKLLDSLRNSNNLYIWGHGSYSIEITNILEENNISYLGYYVDNSTGRDKTEYNIDELRAKHQKIDIIFGHGHYEKIKELDRQFIKNVYIIANPYKQYQLRKSLFDNYDTYKEEIKKRTDDEISRQAIEIFFEVQNDPSTINKLIDQESLSIGNMFCINELKIGKSESYVDVGAYIGDTIQKYIEIFKTYKNIWAFEPEPHSYNVMLENCKEYHHIQFYNIGLAEKKGKLLLESTNIQSAHFVQGSNENTITVPVDTLDNILEDEEISLIKIFTPFFQRKILEGATNILKTKSPRMIINVGTNIEDLLSIMDLLTECCSKYRFLLRYDFPMPTRLFLYAY